MFHKAFYPTPAWLVKKMTRTLNLYGDTYVLEPSAGKGDILDLICEHRKPNVYAIEIVPELRSILRGKGYSVIAEDFLTYTPRIHFTHIIMNPPFDKAEEHLLHAWDILYEGQIVCLLPATILEGKTTKERTICKLVEDYGEEPERVGRAFSNAERTTNAEIVIVRLSKTADGQKMGFDVKNDRIDPEFDEGESRELALNGFVANLLASFNAAAANYAAYNQSRQDILRYAAPFLQGYRGENPMDEADKEVSLTKRYNRFMDLMTQQAWSRILDHPKFQAILTERARKMMNEFRASQRRVDFNEFNIRSMFDELVAKQDEILMGAVLDAFDTMTKYHEENRIYFEGWKNNKAWRVNLRKVVLPHSVEIRFGGRLGINYHSRETLNDIDRAMCVVSMKPFSEVRTITAALENELQYGNLQKIHSTFFEIRAFKKGTIHLRFHDEELGKRFNYLAAKGRNWLPPGESEPAPSPDTSPAQETDQQLLL